jgi:hypothetical protein
VQWITGGGVLGGIDKEKITQEGLWQNFRSISGCVDSELKKYRVMKTFLKPGSLIKQQQRRS